MTTNDLDLPTTDTDTPYAKILTDPATGRSILALDATAAHALLDLLDLVDTADLVHNPDNYSIDPPTAAAAAQVAAAIRSQVGRMLGR